MSKYDRQRAYRERINIQAERGRQVEDELGWRLAMLEQLDIAGEFTDFWEGYALAVVKLARDLGVVHPSLDYLLARRKYD